jgi:phosphoglycerate dehydrogenase-like enzyme
MRLRALRRNLENVLLSPHGADNTPSWLEGAMRFFIENLQRFRKGEPLLNAVDRTRAIGLSRSSVGEGHRPPGQAMAPRKR